MEEMGEIRYCDRPAIDLNKKIIIKLLFPVMKEIFAKLYKKPSVFSESFYNIAVATVYIPDVLYTKHFALCPYICYRATVVTPFQLANVNRTYL